MCPHCWAADAIVCACVCACVHVGPWNTPLWAGLHSADYWKEKVWKNHCVEGCLHVLPFVYISQIHSDNSVHKCDGCLLSKIWSPNYDARACCFLLESSTHSYKYSVEKKGIQMWVCVSERWETDSTRMRGAKQLTIRHCVWRCICSSSLCQWLSYFCVLLHQKNTQVYTNMYTQTNTALLVCVCVMPFRMRQYHVIKLTSFCPLSRISIKTQFPVYLERKSFQTIHSFWNVLLSY